MNSHQVIIEFYVEVLGDAFGFAHCHKQLTKIEIILCVLYSGAVGGRRSECVEWQRTK